ncbi:MAG: hypothetical protein KIT10_07440 [Flavobacteriales bacterium]|nr:hypothetical protein [Flavobacteriales bacterium]
MTTIEASLTGTLRIIGILLLIWVVLRLLRNRVGSGRKRDHRWSEPDGRPKGDVRIEPVPGRKGTNSGSEGQVSDADYEEVK